MWYGLGDMLTTGRCGIRFQEDGEYKYRTAEEVREGVPREEYLFGREQIVEFIGYDPKTFHNGTLTRLIYIHGMPVRKMGNGRWGRFVARKSEIIEWLKGMELIQQVKFKLNL